MGATCSLAAPPPAPQGTRSGSNDVTAQPHAPPHSQSQWAHKQAQAKRTPALAPLSPHPPLSDVAAEDTSSWPLVQGGGRKKKASLSSLQHPQHASQRQSLQHLQSQQVEQLHEKPRLQAALTATTLQSKDSHDSSTLAPASPAFPSGLNSHRQLHTPPPQIRRIFPVTAQQPGTGTGTSAAAAQSSRVTTATYSATGINNANTSASTSGALPSNRVALHLGTHHYQSPLPPPPSSRRHRSLGSEGQYSSRIIVAAAAAAAAADESTPRSSARIQPVDSPPRSGAVTAAPHHSPMSTTPTSSSEAISSSFTIHNIPFPHASHDSRLSSPVPPIQPLLREPAPGGMVAPLPLNEDERVQALLDYRVLDTTSEQAFDQLAVLASQICQTPIALVSLIDSDRQWFKARVGIEASETSRDIAFCAHAILQDEVFEVPDALTDFRFADSPLVVGAPNIRFYAGMPLINNDGFPLGTLCAIDTKPKQLTADQKKALKILAQQTVAQLELRRHVARLTETIVQVHDTKRAWREQVRAAEAAREEAVRARLEAEKANAAKSEFLANMSHEIRTPMHQQLGMATLLAQTPLSKEQSEYVATVQASGEHLLTVLNDILDYSKQESGSLELELQIIDLVATVEQAVELSFRSKEDKQLELIMDIQHGEEACAGLSNLPPSPAPAPPALPQMVVGDVTRLRQVVVNIISNACKFSTKAGGSVRISIGCANRLAASVGAAAHEPLSYQALEALVRNGDISRDYWQRLHGVTPQTAAAAEAAAAAAAHHHRRQSSQPDQQHPPAQAPSVPEYDLFPVAAPGSELAATRFLEVQVSVADSGIGIPRSKLHRLFKAFSQLDVSTTREYGGTGLGLAISAKLVQLMGGQMWCESEEGHGATFSFTFITPVVPQAVAASASATPRVPAGAATPAASSPARDESGPLVCRRLQLLASSPKLVLLVSQSTAWVANLERQLRRWGLDVRVFPTSLEAATWFQQQDASKMLQQLAAVLQDYTPKPRPPVPSSAGGGLSRFGSAVAGYVSSSGQPVPLTGDGTRPSLSSLHTQARPPSSSSLQRPASSGNAAGGSVQQPAAASTPAGTGAAVSATSSSSQQQDGAQSSVHHLAQAVRMAETKANASSSAAVFYACNGSVQVEETLAVEDLAVKWVRKPLLLSKLRSLLQSCVLQKKRSPAAPPSVAPTRRLAEALPVSILVVEDNRVNMKLALKMLQNFGYQPHAAYDGAEAVQLVVDQRQHFDLIFMDMVMPVKDGLTASEEILRYYSCEESAAASSGRAFPPPPIIIAMTASAMEADRRLCEQAGMQDFCAKPVAGAALREKIETWASRITNARNGGTTGVWTGLDAPPVASAATGTGAPNGTTPQPVSMLLKPRRIG